MPATPTVRVVTSARTALVHRALGLTGGAPRDSGRRDVTELAGIGRGTRVLDVGCRDASADALLARELGASVTAVDVTGRAVRCAHRAGVPAVQGDVLELPLRDASYDVVLAERVVSATPAPARAVAEMARVLRPGGRLVITDVTAELDLARRHPQVAVALRGILMPLPSIGYADLVARAHLILERTDRRPADLDAVLAVAERRLGLVPVPAAREARALVRDARAALRGRSLGYERLVARKP